MSLPTLALALALADPAAGVAADNRQPPVPVIVPAPVIDAPPAGAAPAAQPAPAAAPNLPAAEVPVADGAGAPPPAGGGGEITVTADPGPPPEDPMEEVNQKTFEAVQQVDKAVVEPVAKGYKKVVPKPARKVINNFLGNLREPIVFLNFLLQGKPEQAMATLSRFVINTTVGVGGLMDAAKDEPFYLPRRTNGFADTLGFYGVKPGAYLYLPLIGPTTVRDLFGRVVDLSVLPTAVGKPFNDPRYQIPAATIGALNDRVMMEDDLDYLKEESPNAYASIRDYYLRRRQADIDALHNINGTPGLADPVPLDAITGDMPTGRR